MLWLNYPNNPTAATAPLALYERAAALAREHGFVVASDEAYSEIYFGGEPPASALQLADLDGVAVFNTLSKRSSMPGYRSGFVAGDPELIALLKRYRPNVGVAPQEFVQRAAIAAWGDEAHVEQVRATYRAKRELLLGVLEAGGLRSAGGDATFFLWLDAGPDADALAARLLRRRASCSRPARSSGPPAPATCGSRSCRRWRTASARPSGSPRCSDGRPASAETVWLIGQIDQIARTSVSRAIHASSSSVRPASPTSAIAASSSADADRPRDRGLAELAPLVAGARAAAARRAPRRRAAGEAVREALVGPADQAVAERDGEADVGGGEAVREAGGRAAAQVDHRRDEQHEVDERDRREQDRARAGGGPAGSGSRARRRAGPRTRSRRRR